ncbi:hypothetical protein GN956_G24418 [Arapaima gigas]
MIQKVSLRSKVAPQRVQRDPQGGPMWSGGLVGQQKQEPAEHEREQLSGDHGACRVGVHPQVEPQSRSA